jgi:hypothetical protein
VQVPAADESDGSDDEDRMDDMIANIGMEYDLGIGDQHPPQKVQNFFRLLAASDEKVHDGTDLTIGESYGDEIEVQLLESVLQRYREVDY